MNLFNWEIFKNPEKIEPTTIERLKVICEKQLGLHPTKLFNEDTTKDDLWMDSIDDIDLLLSVEKEFDIEIVLYEWEECETIGDMLELVNRSIL